MSFKVPVTGLCSVLGSFSEPKQDNPISQDLLLCPSHPFLMSTMHISICKLNMEGTQCRLEIVNLSPCLAPWSSPHSIRRICSSLGIVLSLWVFCLWVLCLLVHQVFGSLFVVSLGITLLGVEPCILCHWLMCLFGYFASRDVMPWDIMPVGIVLP